MITFDAVTKRYLDGTVAVDALSLEVDRGEVVVLVGPSGCGKTTTMRMVNRMIEPTSGTITVDGSDVVTVDPPALRRRIGYVIQQVGLFPHRTIRHNIATVPKMLGWPAERMNGRVDELLDLVGLDQAVLDRYPHQLSGGQRQRVGVARALAVDPPIMLMDEPFAAVDPIVRTRLQEEFLVLQRKVHKTIIFVTHDIDEAIKMGDRIAILAQGGVLQQFDEPAAILSEPANDFVRAFLGKERGLKRLSLIPVSDAKADPGPVVTRSDDRRQAEAVAAAAGTDWVVVVDDDRRLQGWAWVHDIGDRAGDAPCRPFSLRLQAHDSLRTALDAMVTSHTGVAVRVRSEPDGDRYEGMLTPDLVSQEIL